MKVVITNVCYYRGGGKGSKSKPYRIRKFQNHYTTVTEEEWNTLTEKELLNKYWWEHNHNYVKLTSTSRMKKIK